MGDEYGGPDLAWRNPLLPKGPNGELAEIVVLDFSDAPAEVGELVTMVGYAHVGDRVDVDEVTPLFYVPQQVNLRAAARPSSAVQLRT